MLGVPVLGSPAAVVIAFLLSAVEVVRRAARPGGTTLRPGPDGRFTAAARPQEAAAGLVLYRFGNELFFANAAEFAAEVDDLTAAGDVRWFVLDAEAITDIDTTGAQTLAEIARKLAGRGVIFAVARAPRSLRDLLAHYGLGDLTHYDSNEAALDAYRQDGAHR
ncbi:STAS domain-containing protein [Actinomadura soli]|nr:STAS domain-containing protein [Actinomadura soli]